MRLDEITRRGFLKGMGAVTVGGAVGAAGMKIATQKKPSNVSSGERWKPIGKREQVFADMNSINKISNTEYEVWIKQLKDEYNTNIDTTLILCNVDLQKRTIEYIDVEYFNNGKRANPEFTIDIPQTRRVSPESTEENLYNLIKSQEI